MFEANDTDLFSYRVFKQLMKGFSCLMLIIKPIICSIMSKDIINSLINATVLTLHFCSVAIRKNSIELIKCRQRKKAVAIYLPVVKQSAAIK